MTERDNPADPLVSIVMGSKSDWPTMKEASSQLESFGIPHENLVVSAHRMPEWMMQFANSAMERGIKIIIAGAGGAAHLPGMIASLTLLPVLGVPIKSKTLNGMDSLLSIVQMPGGVPVGTLAIGDAGARNAALLATRFLALNDDQIRDKLNSFCQEQTEKVMENREL